MPSNRNEPTDQKYELLDPYHVEPEKLPPGIINSATGLPLVNKWDQISTKGTEKITSNPGDSQPNDQSAGAGESSTSTGEGKTAKK